MSFRRRIGAILMICWGVLMLGGSILVIDKDTRNGDFNADTIIIALVLGLLPLYVGMWLLWEGIRDAKVAKINKNQEKLIAHAQASNGKITITEAALAIQEPITSTKALLDKMHSMGVFKIDISEEGTLEYVLTAKNIRT